MTERQRDVYGIDDVRRVRARHNAGGRCPPRYLVLDGGSFLNIFTEMELDGSRPFEGRLMLLGIEVVVIQTDGIPMLQVVGSPRDEALR